MEWSTDGMLPFSPSTTLVDTYANDAQGQPTTKYWACK